MKKKYEVTYKLDDEALIVEDVVSEVCMAGAENGVLVLYDYQSNASPDAPPIPRMRRMFAPGVWKSVQNNGPYIEPVKESQ